MFQPVLESDFMDRVIQAAIPYIKRDRERYMPVFDVVKDFIRKHEVYLDSPALLLGEDTDESYFHGVWSSMKLWSLTPHEHATELTEQVCKKIGDKARLNVMTYNEFYIIEYNTRQLVFIRRMPAHAPHQVVDGMRLYPFILKQLSLLYDVMDVGKFSSWEENLKTCRTLDRLIAGTKPQLVKCNPVPAFVVEMRKVVLEYTSSAPYSVVTADTSYPLDVIYYKDFDTTLHDIKRYLDRFTDIDIFYKQAESTIPGRHMTKHHLYTSKGEHLLMSVYNLGTNNVLPHVDREYNRLAPIVKAYVALMNIWLFLVDKKGIPAQYWALYRNFFPAIELKRYFYKGVYIREASEDKIKLAREPAKMVGPNRYYCDDLAKKEG